MRSLVFLWLLFPCLVFADASQLAGLQKRLSNSSVLRSPFVQTRHLKVLSRPLVSEGSFIWSKKQGIYWHVEKPWEQVFLINDERVIQKQKNAQPIVFTAGEQPVFHLFSRAFFSLFSSDLQEISRWFEIEYVDNAGSESWRLNLQPKDQLMKKMNREIVLEGQAHLEKIFLYDHDGGYTEINFTNISTTPEELTADERALFQ